MHFLVDIRNLVVFAQSGQRERNMMFNEKDDSQTLVLGTVPDQAPGEDKLLNLTDFFKRPVLIREFTWSPSSAYDTFYPWELFFSDKRVSNRITNYKLFRGRLHLKIVINGGPFFYGKCIAAYRPDRNHFASPPSGGVNPAGRLTQLPYISIDPTTSRGGEMVVPFFYEYDWFPVTANSTEYRKLGVVLLQELNQLSNTQSAPADWADVPINVFAWMEEIEVKGLTRENIGMLTAQSGKEEGEKQHHSKPVSQIATSVAAAAGALKETPLISPYATAVQAAANGIAGVASAMGYCRPTVVEEPSSYVHRAIASLAATNTTDSCVPLSLDVKNSLTLDPRTVGLPNKDELSLKYLCEVESYLTTALWPVTATYSTVLRAFAVTPSHVNVAGTKRYYTSIGGWSSFFEFWTGSITFRFEVIANTMHRGRLGVYYDPSTTVVQPMESNIQLLHVIDLDQCRTIEVTVPIQQPRTWLTVDRGNTTTYGSAALSLVEGSDNGCLVLAPITPLTVSSYDAAFDSDAYVNVYVKAGEDFQLGAPHSQFTEVTEPTSGDFRGFKVQAQSGLDTKEMNEEVQDSMRILSGVNDNTNLEYIGEAVNSFRQVLKRYVPVYTFRAYASTSGRRQVYTIPYYPLAPAQMMLSPIHSDSFGNPVTYAHLTPDIIVRCAFQGHRGSMRYKLIPWSNRDAAYQGATMAYRTDKNTPLGIRDVNEFSGASLSKTAYSIVSNEDLQCEILGSHATHTSVNPTLEVQLPFYANRKFLTDTPRLPNTAPCTLSFSAPRGRDPASTGGDDFVIWSACGEDFTAFFYCGFPIIDEWDIPAP
jgi:hypothetical protein